MQAEKELSTLCDTELRDKLRELKVYEILNAEKANPHFLELAKKSTTINENLSDISDAEGNVLATPEKLNEYITGFYSSLYRTDAAVQGEIDDFLGPDIRQHPLVRGSILTAEERENLDRDLNILELDNSLEHANLKSAPGADGYSYGFIKKFWHIYRTAFQLCKKWAG